MRNSLLLVIEVTAALVIIPEHSGMRGTHQEVRVASDPDLGQVYDGDIAAAAVHNIPPMKDRDVSLSTSHRLQGETHA